MSAADAQTTEPLTDDVAGRLDLVPVGIAVNAPSVFASAASTARFRDRLRLLAPRCEYLSITASDASAPVLDRLRETAREEFGSRVSVSRDVDRMSVDTLPRCALLPGERGNCPWSERALMAPAESAWVAVTLDLCGYSNVADPSADVAAAVDAQLALADRRHDGAVWPTSAMAQDAWMNRRIALEIEGVVEFIVGGDRTVAEAHRMLGFISARCQAWTRCRSTAEMPLPALRDADPTRGMPEGPLKQQWVERWAAALDSSGVRHRNLTALCPWSLVYRDGRRLKTELLSLLIHADTIYLPPVPAALDLTRLERVALSNTLAAALQQRQALDQIAKPV